MLGKRTKYLLHEDPEEMAVEGYHRRGMQQDREDQDPNREEGCLDLSKPIYG
jgi:hypothetical protein